MLKTSASIGRTENIYIWQFNFPTIITSLYDIKKIKSDRTKKMAKCPYSIWIFYKPSAKSIYHAKCNFCTKEFSLLECDTKFGKGSGTFGMKLHSMTTHPDEFKKIPNFFSKIKKSLEEEHDSLFKSQYKKIEENSLWNFYKPCSGGENNHHVICKFCNKMLSMVTNSTYRVSNMDGQGRRNRGSRGSPGYP